MNNPPIFEEEPLPPLNIYEILQDPHIKNYEDLIAKVKEYNKGLIRDKQLYPTHPSLQAQKNFYEGIKPTENTNSTDVYKYYGTTKFSPFPRERKNLPEGVTAETGGYVTNTEPNIAHIRRGSDREVPLHEARHSDSLKSGTMPYLFGKPWSRIPKAMIALSDEAEKESKIMETLFPSGNALYDMEEMRANLGAMLAKAPKGTTLEQLLSPVLNKIDFSKFKGRTAVGEHAGREYPLDKALFLKVLESEIFPRERWIENQPPPKKPLLQYLNPFYTDPFKDTTR